MTGVQTCALPICSGLGLALCQRIAAAHGSALRIESEPGRGTRVSVTLPVWKEDAP